MNIGVAEANAWDAYTMVRRVHIEQSKGPDSALLATTLGSVSFSSTSKRKFSALDASVSAQSSNASGKKQCSAVPGAVALNGIKESLDMFNKTIECSLAQPQERAHADTSLEHRAKAMSCLQELETHLDDAYMVAMIDLFKCDTSEADTYMSLQRKALCKR